jgi:hypothetical protein
MEDFTFKSEEIGKIVLEAIPVVLKDKLTSSYSSPISKVIEEEINAQDGAIRSYVRQLLTDILSDEKTKKRMADVLISCLIQKGMK